MDTYNFTTSYPGLEALYAFNNKKLTQNKNKINLVVTHGKCSDGFMSATIARKWLIANSVDSIDKVQFYHATYNQDYTKLIEMMKDKYVVICDFSFKKDIFDKMIIATNGNILILDHHKTAQVYLKEVDQQYVVFDMNHSGAFITWTFFYGFDNVSKAVLYVEDNDIWNKALPMTREFTSYLFTREFDFEEYDKFFDDSYIMNTALPIGSGMVIQNDSYIESLIKQCIPTFMLIDKRYYFVVHLNSSVLRSELGNGVLKYLKNANFSAIYSFDSFNNTTNISLRSLDDRSDSTEISRLNGGGGHRNASGFNLNYISTTIQGRVIDEYRIYYLLDQIYMRKSNDLNLLFLNSSVCQKHLAQYLMQERYFGDEKDIKNKLRFDNGKVGYQEGMFCMRNVLNDTTYDEVIDGAIIYNYNGNMNEFHAKAKFSDKLTKHLKDLKSNNQLDPLLEIDISNYGMVSIKYKSKICEFEAIISNLFINI
jgi:oligoribonuclease NrnB/cAMP/cGMP phosphodiesterase (DHH superfamily)